MIHLALADVPVGDDVRRTLASSAGIAGCVVVGAGRVIAYGPECEHETLAAAEEAFPEAHAGWQRGGAEVSSRVQRALALVAGGLTPNRAAGVVGINSSAVYRAQALRESRDVCPCCGFVKPVRGRAGA